MTTTEKYGIFSTLEGNQPTNRKVKSKIMNKINAAEQMVEECRFRLANSGLSLTPTDDLVKELKRAERNLAKLLSR